MQALVVGWLEDEAVGEAFLLQQLEGEQRDGEERDAVTMARGAQPRCGSAMTCRPRVSDVALTIWRGGLIPPLSACIYLQAPTATLIRESGLLPPLSDCVSSAAPAHQWA